MKPSVKMLAKTEPLHRIVVTEDFDGKITELLMPVNLGLNEPLDLIEFAGRWDYGQKSIDKMGDPDIIRRWLESGEESMVEMVDAIFLIECSRVVTHELVRHRIASYQQESQRFVSYEEEDQESLFFVPESLEEDEAYDEAVYTALKSYNIMRRNGVPKQLARYVLPNATRTRIIAKMNLREWRHVCKLRLHKSAQPEFREIMKLIHADLQEHFGTVLFPDDIAEERGVR